MRIFSGGFPSNGNAKVGPMTRFGGRRGRTPSREPHDMAEKTPKGRKKRKPAERGKLSLYGLSIEDALRAAAKTGRPPPLEPNRANRQPKKRAPKAPANE
jgi:hypothetical protein